MANDRNKNEAIFRAEKRSNPYVMVDKYILSDDRLSWKAKGLLIYLLSKPEGWQVYESDLIKRSKDGRDAVRAGIKELISCGYLVRRQIRGENGSFGRMEYTAYEQPIELEDTEEITEDGKSVHGENQPKTENPSAGNAATENPLLSNNDLSNNDLNMFDCMTESAQEIAVAQSEMTDQNQNEIYEALQKYVPKNCFVDGVPFGTGHINEIYIMLINHFDNRLDPEVVRLATEVYFDRACELDLVNGIAMKVPVTSPVGFFKSCYEDAIKLYKATRSSKSRKDSAAWKK